jgi:ankyrin repeat protein
MKSMFGKIIPLVPGITPELFYRAANSTNFNKKQDTVHDYYSNNKLHDAVRFGKPEEVERLLNDGYNPRKFDGHGRSILHLSMSDACPDIITTSIIESKVLDIDVKMDSEEGLTSLQLAAIKGYKSKVELMVKLGANINAVDSDGDTAIFNCHPNCLELLLNHGIDLTIRNKAGRTFEEHWKFEEWNHSYQGFTITPRQWDNKYTHADLHKIYKKWVNEQSKSQL